MSNRGEWIANCLPNRVDRIQSASIFRLEVGPPVPNQLQTLEDLKDRGMVGLYRLEKKTEQDRCADQERYLHQSEFMPTPRVIRDMLGPLGS